MMKKEEIEYWRDLYDKEDKPKYKEIEERISKKIQEYKFITKQDLEEIIYWKYEDWNPGRANMNINRISSLEESYIKEKIQKAISDKDDEVRVLLLRTIKTVGNSIASIILTFYDPLNYGVLDFHAWEELYGRKIPDDLYTNVDVLLDFFEKLREISSITGLPCRDIEKAYFKKNSSISD